MVEHNRPLQPTGNKLKLLYIPWKKKQKKKQVQAMTNRFFLNLSFGHWLGGKRQQEPRWQLQDQHTGQWPNKKLTERSFENFINHLTSNLLIMWLLLCSVWQSSTNPAVSSYRRSNLRMEKLMLVLETSHGVIKNAYEEIIHFTAGYSVRCN